MNRTLPMGGRRLLRGVRVNTDAPPEGEQK
jgi:hypothetical protein